MRLIESLVTVPRASALGLVLWAGGTVLVARTAAGSENYPAILDRQKGVECPRPLTRCLICHDTAAGGEETANRPFALALKSDYGLSGGKAGRELAMAIQTLPDDVDTDLDGTPDQEELAACMNPSGEELSEGPGFGCNVTLGRSGAAHGLPLGLGGCFAVLFWLTRALGGRPRRR